NARASGRMCCAASSSRSLPLDRGRWFGRDVENNPVDALDLVDDPIADRAQEIIGQPRPVRGHRVLAHDGPQRDDVRVGPVVAHDADGPDGQEHRERLPYRSLEPGPTHLFLDYGVGLAEQVQPIRAHLAEHADGEPGSREWLPPDDLRRKPQELAELTDLVLEELAKRLDELELHLQREAADVVVGLDRGRGPAERDRLDDVWIERALGKPWDVPELLGLVLEHGDELGPDPLALDLRVRHTADRVEESGGCVDMDEVHLECVAERVDDRVGLSFSQQTVIDEDARQLVADGAMSQ